MENCSNFSEKRNTTEIKENLKILFKVKINQKTVNRSEKYSHEGGDTGPKYTMLEIFRSEKAMDCFLTVGRN